MLRPGTRPSLSSATLIPPKHVEPFLTCRGLSSKANDTEQSLAHTEKSDQLRSATQTGSDLGVVSDDGSPEDEEDAVMDDISRLGSICFMNALNIGDHAIAANGCIVVHNCILDGGA